MVKTVPAAYSPAFPLPCLWNAKCQEWPPLCGFALARSDSGNFRVPIRHRAPSPQKNHLLDFFIIIITVVEKAIHSLTLLEGIKQKLFFGFAQNLYQHFSALNFGWETTQKPHIGPFKTGKNSCFLLKKVSDSKEALTLLMEPKQQNKALGFSWFQWIFFNALQRVVLSWLANVEIAHLTLNIHYIKVELWNGLVWGRRWGFATGNYSPERS